MTERFPARYYDGKMAQTHDVLVSFEASGLTIYLHHNEPAIHWDYPQLRIPNRPEANRPLFIYHRDKLNATLMILESHSHSSLFSLLPKSALPNISFQLSWKIISLLSLISCLIIIGIYSQFIEITGVIADLFPSSWERALSDRTLNQLYRNKIVCNAHHGNDILTIISDRLRAASSKKVNLTIEVIKDKAINAFALPGEKIVILSGMIDDTQTPEELAGILAHEMGHVIKNHPTQQFIQNFGIGLINGLLFGNMGDTSNIISFADNMYHLHNNRHSESEADDVALQLLVKAQISPGGVATFFERLEKREILKGTASKLFNFVSAHPLTAERIQHIRMTPPPLQEKPILTNDQWNALKSICQ
ncbi:MAG: M48 family metallopeptidase [Alphaproteobacteria bacterium]|nr:M48 family metallopeptidase [Alphaproteobacteria bacterium]